LATSTFWAPNSVRADLHQEERDTPGGKQRFERPAIEVADDDPLHEHADQRRAERKPTGIAASRYQSSDRRQVGPKNALHGPRRVSADHQQFAVRHVDDAHDAVGNGQPECCQQQDRTQREAGEGTPEMVGPRQPFLDRANRRPGGGTHGAVGFDPDVTSLLGQRHQELANVGGSLLSPSVRTAVQADFCVSSRRGSPGPAPAAVGSWISASISAASALVEQGQHLRVGSSERDFLRGLPAHRTLGWRKSRSAARADASSRRTRLLMLIVSTRGRWRLQISRIGRGVEDAVAFAQHHHVARRRAPANPRPSP
jgi:hypothetical protein